MNAEILSWWEKFKLNLSHWYAYAQAWVLGAWGIAAIYWNTMMSEPEHQALYDMVPWGLGKLVPPALFFVTYLGAHGWPQPALEEKLQVAETKAVDKALNGPA